MDERNVEVGWQRTGEPAEWSVAKFKVGTGLPVVGRVNLSNVKRTTANPGARGSPKDPGEDHATEEIHISTFKRNSTVVLPTVPTGERAPMAVPMSLRHGTGVLAVGGNQSWLNPSDFNCSKVSSTQDRDRVTGHRADTKADYTFHIIRISERGQDITVSCGRVPRFTRARPLLQCGLRKTPSSDPPDEMCSRSILQTACVPRYI